MSLDVTKIKQVPLSESQYIKEEAKKTQIVLHHTAGNSSGVGTIKMWNTDDRGRIATCVTISGKGQSKNTYDGQTFYAPRGVDPDVFYPEKEFEEKKDFVVAYVGKPVYQKGLPDYIKPACDIAGVDLIINDRNYTNALSPNEMRKFYNQADVYIVASTIDGTPNPALEAASCGKPVISNMIGNMPEFIEDGVNGFLVDMNVNEYVNKINILKEISFDL